MSVDVDPDLVAEAQARYPGAFVEPLGARAKRPGVRVWASEAREEVLAVTCTSDPHEGARLTPAEELQASRATPGGKAPRCRRCHALHTAALRPDPATRREHDRAYYARNLEAMRAKRRAWAAEHREEERARTRAYYEADPEAARARSRAWIAAYGARTDDEILAARTRLRPDGMKVCRGCKRELPLDAFGANRYEPDGLRYSCRPCTSRKLARSALPLWEELDAWRCVYCDAHFEDTDHVLPRKLDGTDEPHNLRPCCAACNRGGGGKFARPPLVWVVEKYPHLAPWVDSQLDAALAE